MHKPSISIIVPSYNHASFLRQRMDSVLNQTFQDFEIILLDDASSDGSADILREFQNHEKVSQFVVNKTNSGNPFIQWQKGLELAKTEYIWIAESDDLAEPTLLSKLYHKLSTVENGGLAYCQSKTINDAGDVGENLSEWTRDLDSTLWDHDFQMEQGEFPLNYFFIKNFIPNASAVLFKKSALLSSPWVPQAFRYMGDWNAWMEIAREHPILFCAEPLNYHRAHAATTRSKSYTTQYILEAYKIRKIIGQYIQVQESIKETILKALFKKFMNSVSLKSLLASRKGCRMLFSLYAIDKKFPFRIIQYARAVILK